MSGRRGNKPSEDLRLPPQEPPEEAIPDPLPLEPMDRERDDGTQYDDEYHDDDGDLEELDFN
jgi:hypothetical protein